MNAKTRERITGIDTMLDQIHNELCDLLCTKAGNSLSKDEHISIAAAFTANYEAGAILARAMRGLAPRHKRT